MAETKEQYWNVYDDYQDDGWDTREHADAGVSNIDKRVRLDRYVLAESFPEPPAPPPVSEPVNEVPVDETRWMDLKSGEVLGGWQPANPSWTHDKFQRVIVRSAAADEELRDKLANAAVDLTAKEQTIATLTRERDEARAQLGGSQAHVKTLHELRDMDASRIADLERQLAEATKPLAEGEVAFVTHNTRTTFTSVEDGDVIRGHDDKGPFTLTAKRGADEPCPPPADEAWMEAAASEYAFQSGRATWREAFKTALRHHAPRQRYPEVCEFLDAANDPSMLRYPSGKWWVGGFINDIFRSSEHHDTLAAACREVLDSVKERADG